MNDQSSSLQAERMQNLSSSFRHFLFSFIIQTSFHYHCEAILFFVLKRSNELKNCHSVWTIVKNGTSDGSIVLEKEKKKKMYHLSLCKLVNFSMPLELFSVKMQFMWQRRHNYLTKPKRYRKTKKPNHWIALSNWHLSNDANTNLINYASNDICHMGRRYVNGVKQF